MIFSGDAIFQEIIDLFLDDLRKNPWIIEDILSDFVENPFLKNKYGYKEIQKCIDWFKNNKITTFLNGRLDVETFPCVTIAVKESNEMERYATLGDTSPYSQQYTAEELGKSIPYIVQPFIPLNYDPTIGFITIDNSIDLITVNKGMGLIDSQTGVGYLIESIGIVNNQQGLYLQLINSQYPQTLSNSVGIIPRYKTCTARREWAQFSEKYSIGCHVTGDIAQLCWLHSIVLYGLMRYREGLVEHSNFQLSTLSNSEIYPNTAFQSDNVYSRQIEITGMVTQSWIKSPRRIIEKTNICPSGIKIIGPKPKGYEDPNTLWTMLGDECDETNEQEFDVQDDNE
jgi:hypothetical protein